MMEKKVYYTNCVNSTATAIFDMINAKCCREIAYRTLLKHVGIENLRDVFPCTHPTLENDYHVRYFKSVYKGEKCVYVVHSAIEYIFI